MKLKLYNEIVGDINQFCGLTRDCADMLIRKYPNVSPNAIQSIVSSETITRMKTQKFKWRLYQRVDYVPKYEEAKRQGEPPGIILRMAAANNLPPALFARVFLERYFTNDNSKPNRTDLTRFLKDTTLIQDHDLAYEIYLCVLYDDRNGFFSDAFCLGIGNEYEMKLQECLIENNIAYATEVDLKARGYDKTPDCKLEIPIAVNGFIINWIESKARFGCPSIHKTHIKEQFLSYWNRFGPGLVIYWFGFVDELVEPNEKRFIIMDHFPKNIIRMNPKTLPTLAKK